MSLYATTPSPQARGKAGPSSLYLINQTSRRLNKAKRINSTRLRKSFFQEKLAASGGIRTHNTLLSRPSALPAKLPRQLS